MHHSKLIDKLGGTQAVADGLKVSKAVVSGWRTRGISEAGMYKIKAFAERRGFKLPASFLKQFPTL